MALNIPAGDAVASLEFMFDNDPEPMYCTIGLRAAVAPLDASHAERLFSAWRQNGLTRQVSSAQLRGAIVRVQQDGGGTVVYEHRPAAPVNGGTVASGFPSNVAVIAEKLTARAGRRGRGRLFVPGIPDTDADNAGVLSSSAVTGWNTVLLGFHQNLLGQTGGGTLEGADVVPLLFHGPTTTTTRTTGPGTRTVTTTEGAPGPLPDVITGFSVDNMVGTQRRRLR